LRFIASIGLANGRRFSRVQAHGLLLLGVGVIVT